MQDFPAYNPDKEMKVAFFGTSDKSIPILEVLNHNFDLALCITKTDTKIGRKQLLKEAEVKIWAKDHDIEFLQINSLKNEFGAYVADQLENHKIDLGIVADFNFIIPENILNTPKMGLINIHFSLLPKYRGASPVQHAILNGEQTTGVTFQKMDKGMDTGDIIYQFEYNLSGAETTGSLYSTLFDQSAKTLTEVIKGYASKDLTPYAQDESQASYCYSKTHPRSTYIYKEDARINWKTQSLEEIENMIRAFNPWPITWTTLEDMENGELYVNEEGLSYQDIQKPYKNRTNKDLRVKIEKAIFEGDILKIRNVQVEGKSKMDWKSFLNGYVA